MHMSRRCARDVVAKSEFADLVIGAGDYCNHRQGLDEAMAMLAPSLAKSILVPGNAESAEELHAAAGPATVLHGNGTESHGLKIFGLGYAVPVTPFGEWSCDLSESHASEMLDRIDEADILIVHAPPKGVADENRSGQSLGSRAIRTAIERVQPRLALCGHIHDSWGRTGKIGKTLVHNLGPDPVWFDL
jgi:Icc-related predicted phosphoesterase